MGGGAEGCGEGWKEASGEGLEGGGVNTHSGRRLPFTVPALNGTAGAWRAE